MQVFITGAAEFTASNLSDRLLADGHAVVGFDNLSTGFERFLEQARTSPRFRFARGDLLDTAALNAAMAGADIAFHLAANADMRFGTKRSIKESVVLTLDFLRANHWALERRS